MSLDLDHRIGAEKSRRPEKPGSYPGRGKAMVALIEITVMVTITNSDNEQIASDAATA
jgi:hypothetical protein